LYSPTSFASIVRQSISSAASSSARTSPAPGHQPKRGSTSNSPASIQLPRIIEERRRLCNGLMMPADQCQLVRQRILDRFPDVALDFSDHTPEPAPQLSELSAQSISGTSLTSS
jgi:hypothetical protein